MPDRDHCNVHSLTVLVPRLQQRLHLAVDAVPPSFPENHAHRHMILRTQVTQVRVSTADLLHHVCRPPIGTITYMPSRHVGKISGRLPPTQSPSTLTILLVASPWIKRTKHQFFLPNRAASAYVQTKFERDTGKPAERAWQASVT